MRQRPINIGYSRTHPFPYPDSSDLIKRYVDWRMKGIESGKDKRHFHPSMIHKWIQRDFGDSTYYVSQNRFVGLVENLQTLIDGTILGGIRRRSGERNYHSFEDHLKILRGS